MRQILDCAYALSEYLLTMFLASTDPDKVSVAVKAFITGDMPAELIELLEKIILEVCYSPLLVLEKF
jgi:hypothetical protein